MSADEVNDRDKRVSASATEILDNVAESMKGDAMIGKVEVIHRCHTRECSTKSEGMSGFCIDCEERVEKLGKGLLASFSDASVDMNATEQDSLQLFLIKCIGNWKRGNVAATKNPRSAYEEFAK